MRSDALFHLRGDGWPPCALRLQSARLTSGAAAEVKAPAKGGLAPREAKGALPERQEALGVTHLAAEGCARCVSRGSEEEEEERTDGARVPPSARTHTLATTGATASSVCPSTQCLATSPACGRPQKRAGMLATKETSGRAGGTRGGGRAGGIAFHGRRQVGHRGPQPRRQHLPCTCGRR